MNEWYNNTWSDVVKRLKSDIRTGLTLERVEALKETQSQNDVLQFKATKLSKIFINEVKHLWVIISIAEIISLIIGSRFLAATTILAALIINLYLLIRARLKEHKKLMELEKLSPVSCKVLRNGKICRIDPDELVVGDIVYLDKNEIVPADLRIIESEELKARENAITGENYIVEKYETKIEDKEISLEEMRNILFRSSTIVEGNGTGIVVATGRDTQIGKIITMLLNEQKKDNIFIQRIHKILGKLSIFFGILNIFVAAFSRVITKNTDIAFECSSMIVLSGFIQIIIPIFYLCSQILDKKFEKEEIKLNNILAFENLSSTSLLCIDHTEGLYENVLTVEKIYTDNNIIDVVSENHLEQNDENIKRVISISMLCNDCKSDNAAKLNGRSEIIDYALVKFGQDNNVDKYKLNRELRKIFQIPYDSDKKIATTLNKVEEKYRANVKGTVDGVLSKCTHIMKNGIEKEITEEDIKNIKGVDFNMSSQCLTVIALAYRNFNYEPTQAENIESNLVFVGLIGLSSKVKKGVNQAIGYCKKRGIKIVVFTEENILTAASMAKSIGFNNYIDVVSGVELDNMNEDEFKRSVEKASIFSRTKPEQKYKIIKTFKDMGFKVTSSVYRLSELPSLKLSDIGISITQGCSGIIKNLSDIWLSEGNIFNVINLLIDGNKVIQSVNKIMTYILSSLVGSLGFVFFTFIMRNKILISETHMLWINIVVLTSGSLIILNQFKNERYKFEAIGLYKNLVIGENFKLAIKNSLLIIVVSSTINLVLKQHNINMEFLNFCILSMTCLINSLIFTNNNKISNMKSRIILYLNITFIALSFLLEKNHSIGIKGIEALFLGILVNVIIVLRKRIYKVLSKIKRRVIIFKKILLKR